MFRINDKVRRIGPHFANGVDYGDKECQVGSIGTIVQIYHGGEVSVAWDRGNSSRIVASSLLCIDDEAIDEEIKALFGITPTHPCETCGCPTNGKH